MLSEVLDRCLKEVQAKQLQAETPQPQITVPAPTVSTQKNAPTPQQVNFFHTLVKGKQLTDTQRTHLLSSLPALDKRSISTTIQWLVGLPWIQRVWVPRPAVRPNSPVAPKLKIDQGYYAVVDPLDSTLKFYQVRTPKEGKWAGYVFLSQVSGDNKIPMKNKLDRDRIFAELVKNPLEALKRFGKEIGQCGHCRKQLTDEESRAFGIGPVCRGKLGV